MPKIKVYDDDGPHEDLRDHSAAEATMAPDGWAGVPEVAGTDFHANAKIAQRLLDKPGLRDVILGHLAVNEMPDHDPSVVFNGSVTDN